MAYFIVLVYYLFTRAAPRRITLLSGSALGVLIFAFLKVQRKRMNATFDNLRNLYPDNSGKELAAIVKKVCRHFGRFLTECGKVLPSMNEKNVKRYIRFEGFENFEKALAKGKGAIFATAHFGNFEIANGAFAAMGYPVCSVIREVDNPWVDRLFDKARYGSGLKIIKKEKSAGEILRNLRKGHIVTINIDQNAAFNNIFAPFFGRLAATFITPAVMSMRTGAPILPVLSFRDDESDVYTVRVYPEIEIESTGDRAADIRLATCRLNRILEDAIREAPEQWLWIHRRWKTVPGPEELETIQREEKIIKKAMREKGKNIGAA